MSSKIYLKWSKKLNTEITLKTIREKAKISQVQMAEELGIAIKTYRNFENDSSLESIPIGLVRKAALICGVEASKLFGCDDSGHMLFDPIFSSYFEIVKSICPDEDRKKLEEALLDDMIHSLNIKIADSLVESLTTKVSEIPLLDKLKKMIIMNGVGATVRIWSIVEQASRDNSQMTAKEKLLNAAQNGFALVPHSKAERDFLTNWVEMWPEEMCDYILQNNQIFIDVLKKISKQADSAISSNEKILKFVRRFNKTL